MEEFVGMLPVISRLDYKGDNNLLKGAVSSNDGMQQPRFDVMSN